MILTHVQYCADSYPCDRKVFLLRMSTVPSESSLAPSAQKPVPTFEFTKRKRWAELLITELPDAIAFVLSPTCKILFCGTAVKEILGWNDDELIDVDLLDLMNGTYR